VGRAVIIDDSYALTQNNAQQRHSLQLRHSQTDRARAFGGHSGVVRFMAVLLQKTPIGSRRTDRSLRLPWPSRSGLASSDSLPVTSRPAPKHVYL